MTPEELIEKIKKIQILKCETNTLELKSADGGCPERLYDTLSSFSNQDDGGTIVFGINEKQGYKEVGVYDAQDLQKKITEQCQQMSPKVRPLITVAECDGKVFVSAEIPGIDLSERPCFYSGSGRLKGSFIRVGDADEHMNEYEIYSYEAYRKKYQDDVRTISRIDFSMLDQNSLSKYINEVKIGKPNISSMSTETIYTLMSILRNNEVTLSAAMVFCVYPQAYFPQLCITAIVVPGTEIGDTGESGERFLDNQRIEGDIFSMLEGAISFVKRNMHVSTIIDPITGKREDRTDYPITAIREAVLNALVHRDYSIHTEGMPIQIVMYTDRIEIINPGGLYGRLTIDQLGKIQPDTRNPVLVSTLETLHITENRYSGIPTIRKEMEKYNLPSPEFMDQRGTFLVRMRKKQKSLDLKETDKALVEFCKIPRTREEVVQFFHLSSATYTIQRYVQPLIDAGYIKLKLPDKPSSKKQRYYSD